jgi:large subunit ribosomal protein L7/L12
MTRTSEKIRRLQERGAEVRAKLQQAQAEERKREEDRRRRREVLVGALVLELVERGEWPRELLWEALDKHIRSARDRQLFGLPVDAGAKPASEAKSASEAPAPRAEA